MADNDNKRRLRRPIRSQGTSPNVQRPTDAAAASVFPQPAAPMPDWAQSARRPAREQAHQDVSDVTAFLSKVDRQREQGHATPKPRPMREVLGAFNSSPQDQTRIQVLAAAAAARHLEGIQSANAQRWERLAQENAARLEALRSQQYHREQAAYQAARMAPEQVQQRDTERSNAEAVSDKRMFDAAAAVALGYVAARALPPFDKLDSLSTEHLNVPEPRPELDVPTDPAAELTEKQEPDLEAETTPDTELVAEQETAVDPAATQDPEAKAQADVSADLKPVATDTPGTTQAPNRRSEVEEMGQALKRAGRGLATAIGPTHGDDEVAPNLSPVNLPQLAEELLEALGAVKLGHPRSAKEMLNIEREPDQNNEVAFVQEVGTERDLSMTPSM